MPFRIIYRKPTATIAFNTGSTSIVTGSWTQLTASLAAACTAMEVFNPSGSTIQLATGLAGHEVALPYTVIPGGEATPIAIEIAKGTRLSAKAVDANMTSGYFTLNFFG
jgi:hypothetical protein